MKAKLESYSCIIFKMQSLLYKIFPEDEYYILFLFVFIHGIRKIWKANRGDLSF